jgi:hypothetical protein
MLIWRLAEPEQLAAFRGDCCQKDAFNQLSVFSEVACAFEVYESDLKSKFKINLMDSEDSSKL